MRRKHAWECSCWEHYPNPYRKDICLKCYDACVPKPRERKTHCVLNGRTMVKELPACPGCDENNWVYLEDVYPLHEEKIFMCETCKTYLMVNIRHPYDDPLRGLHY